MLESEVSRFLILLVILLLILIIGIIVFVFEYRRRLILNETEKARINEQHSQDLLTTQLEVQQQTMQYIGREIHDNVGQQLTLAALYTQQIDHAKKYPEIKDRIVAVSKIINDSLNDLRSLSKSLTDDSIAQSDFISLVKQECEKIKQAGICTIGFSSNLDTLYASYSAKSISVRIVQEFLQNSLKHAACSNINVEVNKSEGGIIILMSDNGKGFLESETKGKGIGLANIKKRAAVIGASVFVESQLNVGTKMQLFIPDDKLNS